MAQSSRSVSAFFKNMFRRVPQVPDDGCVCHSCSVALEPEPVGHRILESCPDCQGLWLSYAQLKEILDQVSHKAESWEDFEDHIDTGHTFNPSREPRNCPSCRIKMENYKFEGTDIWIDACPAGHGIWLDQGELRLLAQRVQKEGPEYDVGEVMDAVSNLILGSL